MSSRPSIKRYLARRSNRKASSRNTLDAPIPFVVGMNRSGTTLLRMMLDAHPQLTMPPETHFVPELIDAAEAGDPTPEKLLATITSQREWGDFGLTEDQLLEGFRRIEPLNAGDALRHFYSSYAERIGKPRFGEKTPLYVRHMRKIEGALPEARFIHLIRDGRDVCLSIRDRADKDHPVHRVARRWKRRVGHARKQGEQLEHYLELRYEDLILDPEPVLRQICEFVDLPWDDAVLNYHEKSAKRLKEMARELPTQGQNTGLSVEDRLKTHARTTQAPDSSRVSRWRGQMTDDDREIFEREAGDLLSELGYPMSRDEVYTGSGTSTGSAAG